MLNPDINSLPLFIEEANIGKQLQQSMVNAGYFEERILGRISSIQKDLEIREDILRGRLLMDLHI